MNIFRPFKAVQPRRELAHRVCSPPYDVLSEEEARGMVKANPLSYLLIEKSEIDYTGGGARDVAAHKLAKGRLKQMLAEGVLTQDGSESFFVYRQATGRHQQCGIVGVMSVEGYLQGRIKKHENTRVDKERERAEHIDTLDAHTGPVFIVYPPERAIEEIIGEVVKGQPDIDFTATDGCRHSVWKLEATIMIGKIEETFSRIGSFYIADGHHRAAAAAKVAQQRGDYQTKEYGYFLSVLFASDQIKIMDYNRVVRDLRGLSTEEFLQRLAKDFLVEAGFSAKKPEKKGEFGLYLPGGWFLLRFRSAPKNGLIGALDVSILQDFVLSPILGIEDPRGDDRIDFIGGSRGMAEIEKCVDTGRFAVGFSLYPTSLTEMIAVAAAGKVMPPKSTWFEPKLASGLFTHLIEGF